MSELRIYYESVEQANHYVRPLVEDHLRDVDASVRIRMVKLRSTHGAYSREVAPIVFWKDPDIFLTYVHDGIEYPVLMLEFSTAVFTEDHELQRFDGLVTAAKNECPYVKISPTSKESRAGHGGNTEFNHLAPYAMILAAHDEYPIHIDWPVETDANVVKTDDVYPACPPELPKFDVLIGELLTTAVSTDLAGEWTEEFYARLRTHAWFSRWLDAVEACELPGMDDFDSSRVFTREGGDGSPHLVLKFNRFGHAMDPERGMLPYHSLIDDGIVSAMIFDPDNRAWFKSTPREDSIDQLIQDGGLSAPSDYLEAFVLASGLYEYDAFGSICDRYSGGSTLDISDFAQDHYEDLNKPLRTILVFSTSFSILDEQGREVLRLTWPGFSERSLFAEEYPAVTPVRERTRLTEDDVTYLVAHTVLPENGFEVVSISYPGAQGDNAILVEPDQGRRQQRKYVDVVSTIPGEVLNLEENKGKFSPRRVQGDIDELRNYKTASNYVDALETFSEHNDIEATDVVIGVGFWANQRFSLSDAKDLDLRQLDYFVCIDHDMREWQIWSTMEQNPFDRTRGSVELPDTFEIGR